MTNTEEIGQMRIELRKEKMGVPFFKKRRGKFNGGWMQVVHESDR